MDVLRLAIISVVTYLKLVGEGMLHLRKERIGNVYKVEDGKTYVIFRETQSSLPTAPSNTVLIVGFRLKLIDKNPFWHFLFQRLCILTTPFWSGFKGFRIKLWMVDPQNKNYLGIYKWEREENARRYVQTLVKVLYLVSTHNSVWYTIYPHTDFEHYLSMRRQKKYILH